MGDGLRVPSFTVAGPDNMSEWDDQHEEDFHDAGKVGSKRPQGSRGPEGKLAQKARTLRRRAERADGHLNAEQLSYRLGAMTEQSFELVLCRLVPERDLHNAWQTFCGWITRRTRALRRARTKPNATFTSSATSCDWHQESGWRCRSPTMPHECKESPSMAKRTSSRMFSSL